MNTFTVVSANEYFFSDGGSGWHLKMRRDYDGKHGSYIFPSVAFEWRAAEYDLDPMDKDTLLDILLHEPFVGNAKGDVGGDPAFTEGGLSAKRTTNKGIRRVGDPEPVSLMNADTIADARTAMLLRIQYAKTNRVAVKDSLVTGKGVSPLAKIKAGMDLDPSSVESKRRYVALRRKGLRGQLSKIESKELQNLDRSINTRKAR